MLPSSSSTSSPPPMSSRYGSRYEVYDPPKPYGDIERLPTPSMSQTHRSSRRRHHNNSPLRTHLQALMSSRARFVFTPRALTTFALWLLSIWLVHTFLFPLPLPSLRSEPKAVAQDRHLSSRYPLPAEREGEDWIDSVDPLYRPLAPLPAPDPPFPRLRPTRFLPDHCLESWFLDGETICGKGDLGPEDTLDATWLWVNGSDERWRREMVHWRNEKGIFSPEHHFREQNELVYSMRSVLKALGGHLRTFHLIVYDYAFDPIVDLERVPQSTLDILETKLGAGDIEPSSVTRDRNASRALVSYLKNNWRVAQTPSWLDFSRRNPNAPTHPVHPASGHEKSVEHAAHQVAYPDLRYATHSEIFHLPTIERDAITMELGEKEWREREWRKKALPTFNSMSIETRIGWLPGLADVSIALNDDFFMLRRHAVSDFHSPLYGNVIRFDQGYYQQVRPKLDKANINDAGEIGGLYHANYLLSQRFPKRLRPYFSHTPKVITRSLHHEANLMFKEDLTMSSSRKFRELHSGNGDLQMQWLLTSLRVERWREALLWTYIVANLGGTDGFMHDNARKSIAKMFGMGEGDNDVTQIEVHRGVRWTREHDRMYKMFEQAGWEPPKTTRFTFSSLDGHMPPILRPGESPSRNDRCVFDLDRCLGPFWQRATNVSANDMFKRLTFQHAQCGDCLIMALVTSSGPLGLSAFFPSASASYTNPSTLPIPGYVPPPHLPLTPTWHEADFSLKNVMATTSLPGEKVNLRRYSMRLLSRYLYVAGKSPSHFHMLTTADKAKKVFDRIDAKPEASIVGLNDDIENDYDDVRAMMNEWFEKRWPEKAIWERGWGE